jgi:small-conductance mechanosensitive channel
MLRAAAGPLVDLFGVRLIGTSSTALAKLGLSVALAVAVVLLRLLIVAGVRMIRGGPQSDRLTFWVRQGTSLAAFVLVVSGLLSIWFDDAKQLQTALGLVTAGVAIASQRVITAFAGYLVIMRGKHFTVGDRIKMAGVQGDVISLGFLQTRILEMGQPPDVTEQEPPGMWVRARQFTGRIVTITNDKVFDEPVYNFTRDFPFIWEELRIGVGFEVDHARAEQILLDAASAVMQDYGREADAARQRVQERYGVALDEDRPRVYWRITDNWLELAIRLVVPEHGIREIKDRMSRRILPALAQAGIGIASTTYEIVGVPPIRVTGDAVEAARRMTQLPSTARQDER